jgi:acetyl esterase
MTLGADPRADPRLAAMMTAIGLGGAQEPLPFPADAPLEVLQAFVSASEEGYGMLFDMLSADLPSIEGVTSSVEVIRGIDGNDITLFVDRPTDAGGPLPALLHIHGGGMVLLEAAGKGFARWRQELAATGLVVVGVEFRNGGGKLGPHPFPAGLNDCTSALQWMGANRESLGISKIVITGESGGGNLSLATTLRAKRDGHLALIDGVYAQCPYISGAYAAMPTELTSLHENDGYFLTADSMAAMVRVYDPTAENATNPLAWPYHATQSDLEGLPPHVISVNQLDPLRDEGLAFAVKLVSAGVSTVSRTVNGTSHAGDTMFRAALPEVYLATVRDISSFAKSL